MPTCEVGLPCRVNISQEDPEKQAEIPFTKQILNEILAACGKQASDDAVPTCEEGGSVA